MDPEKLIDVIRKGESSTVQFKERVTHPDSLAQEMVAFSNSNGGLLIFGVNDKTGGLNGLSYSEIQDTNQLLVNVATQNIFPPIVIKTETITIEGQNIIITEIREGFSKPYKDRNGIIFVKNGSDKRKVTSNEEIARLLQESKLMFADESIIYGSNQEDINIDAYRFFIQKKYQRSLEDLGVNYTKSLENLNLLKNNQLTLAGLLLFSRNRHTFRPQFSVQCIAVDQVHLLDNTFTDSESSFEGTLPEIFERTIAFIDRNLKKIPSGQSFNSSSVWEVPYEVFEELIVNALVHRDYFINTTIKVIIFSDRIEIISPGKLPNSLTIENILSGISIPRNPILQSLAQYTMPYKGLGTGIMRAISRYPDIQFVNEVEKERFVAVIKRKQ
jgi:ATP-dependent DNA helicase RecG